MGTKEAWQITIQVRRTIARLKHATSALVSAIGRVKTVSGQVNSATKELKKVTDIARATSAGKTAAKKNHKKVVNKKANKKAKKANKKAKKANKKAKEAKKKAKKKSKEAAKKAAKKAKKKAKKEKE